MTLVVVAAIVEDHGRYFVTKRLKGGHLEGLWEFPGGKIEPGESPRHALDRELEEELGIRVREATPWITRRHVYTHATVCLHFFRVTAWDGEPKPLEDQGIAWQRPGATNVAPMLPANAPLLAALALPAVMVVSDAEAMGIDPWVSKLIERALDERLLVQVREKTMGRQPLQHLLSRVLARAGSLGARVVVNSDSGELPQATGVHLTSRALMAAISRPAGELVGASAHDAAELDQAEKIGVDYAVVGPVKATASHPGATPLGWDRFEALVRERPMPCYAIGGLTRADLAEAKRRGAHGVALRGAAFE